MGIAYDRGRNDGKSGKSENPYMPGEDSRKDYRDGNERGSDEKSNAEAND